MAGNGQPQKEIQEILDEQEEARRETEFQKDVRKLEEDLKEIEKIFWPNPALRDELRELKTNPGKYARDREVTLRAHSIRLVSGLDRNAPKATVANRARIVGENRRNIKRLVKREIFPTH